MATIAQILKMGTAERVALNDAALQLVTDVPCASAEFHAYALKHWQVKFSGPKPTPEMLKINYLIDGGRRAGFEPMWLSLTLRENGATVAEYMRHEYGPGQCPKGAAHNNACKYNTERGGPGWFVRVPLGNDSRAGRWQHVITDKGMAQLNKRVAALTGNVDAALNAKNKFNVKAHNKVKVARKRNAKAAPVEATPDSAAAAREAYIDNALDAANQGVASDAQLAVLAAKFNG